MVAASYSKGYWGMASPFFRGLQVTIILGFGGFSRFAGELTGDRNLIGDFRDVEQDRKAGLKTWPVVLASVTFSVGRIAFFRQNFVKFYPINS